MASIARDKNGNRRILFVAPDGKRPTIRLGKVSQRTAEGVKYRIEQLLEALSFNRSMEADLVEWVTNLEPWLAKKLAAVGLIHKPEAKHVVTLGDFLDAYIQGRTDIKPLTKRHLTDARRNLIAYFGEHKPLADINPGDADDFRRDLSLRLGENTVRRQCGRAKQFFRAAVRKRLIRDNPFGDMKGCGVQANRARDHFISRADAQKVLDACPDSQWRLLFALSRFGGLRCPSEHLALRWGDVDWDKGLITVHSPKTEHHEGKECRIIPLFSELRPYLEQAFDQAEPGSEYVITRYRSANANLRTQLQRIIKKSGLKPWPKLFHNLRATRETELAEKYPVHVVCEWIGNSVAVAAKHYLRVTDEHYREAATHLIEAQPKAAQKAAQQAHAEARSDSHEQLTAHEKTPVVQGFATFCDSAQNVQVPPVGLEPTTL